MKRRSAGAAIPRHYIFVLQDGRFVVQWVERKVQDIMTGGFLPYQRSDFGHWITDEELAQLRTAGRVEHYTARYVWLVSLPEATSRSEPREKPRNQPSHRVRAYYITTALPISQLKNVRAVLPKLKLAHMLQAKIHDENVAVYGAGSYPFMSLQDAEGVLAELMQLAPGLFYGASVAVFEMALGRQAVSDDEPDIAVSLDVITAAFSDTSVTAGKHALLVGGAREGEKDAIESMMVADMEMLVTRCETGRAALPLLEDAQPPPTLMIMDSVLPDMHVWAFIQNLREIRSLASLDIIVISENSADEVFALKVARVAGFLSRPLQMRKLREKIWMVLRDGASEPPS